MGNDEIKPLAGMRVVSFESRRAEETERLIEKFGGAPHVSPSMREVSVEDDEPIVDFCHRLVTGEIDLVIFLTGVGTRELVERGSKRIPRQRLLDALSDVTTVLRGPKPLAIFRELGVSPSIVVGQPNTWREILLEIDQRLSIANQVVAIQEYGTPNVSLSAGLEARGATVVGVQVYRWALPEDLEPLRENIARLAAGEVDVVLFTSAQQATHLLQVAEQDNQKAAVVAGLARAVVASVGPSTTEALRAHGIAVDLEPTHSKLGRLVSETAEQAAELLSRKRSLQARLSAPADPSNQPPRPWDDSVFMRACRRQPTSYTPVWLMRQAGRYMAEYRAVREKTTFLELCKNPQLCSEVMCTAVDKLGVDAAIIFSDLLPILEPMGMDLEFAAGEGPRIHNPVREASDVHRVAELESVDSLHFVFETVAQTRRDLPEHLPVIGFAGAPFTLASYAVEGGGSRNYLHTKTLMYREPEAWDDLMQRLSRSIVRYLNAQIRAGAQAVQLFDSWVGCLGPGDYRRFVLPYIQQIAGQLDPGAPLIHFGAGNPALLPHIAEAGGDVIGIDWRIDLADAWDAVGRDRAVQGNLEPLALLADVGEIRQRAKAVLDAAGGQAGHIFNLGHGVLPQTPVDHARAVVDIVHEESSK